MRIFTYVFVMVLSVNIDLVSHHEDLSLRNHTKYILNLGLYVTERKYICNVVHHNCVLSVDVIAIPETTQLLLARTVPNVKRFRRMNLNSDCRDILTFKLVAKHTVNERSLPHSTITHNIDLRSSSCLLAQKYLIVQSIVFLYHFWLSPKMTLRILYN